MSEWISIEDRLPDEFKTVLCQHIEDLYPVTGFYIDENEYEGGMWLYEGDGPEDEQKPDHRNMPLLRDPTHWMPLPNPPEK